MKITDKILPEWLLNYQQDNLSHDVVAGMVFTILVIPQSLAYALLAGLPPHFGLYVSIFPVLAYAFLGSSRVLAVGPVAITAMMTYSVLSPIVTPGSDEYVLLSATLALLSGICLLLFGYLRLGFLSQLLSRPVMSGFISGAAVLIIVSQINSLCGIDYQGEDIRALLAALTEQLPHRNPATLIMGAVALCLLLLSRHYLAAQLVRWGMTSSRAALVTRLVPLLIVLLATVIVILFHLDSRADVAVVGAITEGVPGFTFFMPDDKTVTTLALPALLMALISMVQGIAIAESLAIKRREKIQPNRELIGLGVSNIVAAYYGGMPVGSGISRSAVNVAAGARTPLSGVISAGVMLVIVAGASRWLSSLPLTVLAANIIVAAMSMIDTRSFKQAWQYDRADALALLGTASGVIFLGIERGIILGVGLSLATLIYRASMPHIAVIGRIPGTEHFRNIVRHQVETLPHVLFLRIDESLFFGNLNAIEGKITQELSARDDIQDLVLVMNAVNMIDTTAMMVLNELNANLQEQGVTLHLAEIKGPVQDRLTGSPFLDTLSGQVFFTSNIAFETLAARYNARP